MFILKRLTLDTCQILSQLLLNIDSKQVSIKACYPMTNSLKKTWVINFKIFPLKRFVSIYYLTQRKKKKKEIRRLI